MVDRTVSADLLSRPGLIQTLGISIIEASRDRVVATMPVDDRHRQPRGYLHGGATVALAESVASIGGYLNSGPNETAFGIEINANHVRSVREGIVTAVATPLHRGKTTQVWEIRVTDDGGHLVCVSRCTVAIVVALVDERA